MQKYESREEQGVRSKSPLTVVIGEGPVSHTCRNMRVMESKEKDQRDR